MLNHPASILVGLILVLTGFSKAFMPQEFVKVVPDYPLLRRFPPEIVTGAAAAWEVMLGTGLSLSVAPHLIHSLTCLTLLFFNTLLLRGIALKSLTHCGCYGGIIHAKPRQAMRLNFLYMLMLGYGFLHEPKPFPLLPGLVVLFLSFTITLLITRRRLATATPGADVPEEHEN